MKWRDPAIETELLEQKIDHLVYHLYGLTYPEAKLIDPTLSEDEFAKCRA